VTNSKLEEVYAKWLTERFDLEDKEQLAAFQVWLERGPKDPNRSVTVQQVVAAWQKVIERQKMH